MTLILRKQEGFTLPELLTVVAVISILSATAIPAYLGAQERGRRGAVNRVCSSSIPELQGWIQYDPDDDQSVRVVFLSATNDSGTVFYQKAISAD